MLALENFRDVAHARPRNVDDLVLDERPGHRHLLLADQHRGHRQQGDDGNDGEDGAAGDPSRMAIAQARRRSVVGCTR